MKALIVLITICITLLSFTTSPPKLRKGKNKAFTRGEKLTYRVHYGLINAGEAVLEVKGDSTIIGKRKTLHLVGNGKSLGAFNWFFKVRDNYESYLDEESLMPWLFIRNVEEGSYKLDRTVLFNQYKKKAVVDDSTYVVPAYCQDLLSAFYYARTLDLENLALNDTVSINTFFDKENYQLMIKYIGKDTLDSDIGDIRCLKFRPLLQVGRVFKEEEDMTVWISDDPNKVPVRVQANVVVGSIKMDLNDTEGLLHKLAKVKD